MDFAFDANQLEFRDAVSGLLAEHCSPVQLRAAWENDNGRIPQLWDHLVEMGVVSLLAPESVGGLGLGYVDLVLILEASGWAGLPEPLVETAAVAVPLLAAHDPVKLRSVLAGGSVAARSPLDEHGVWIESCPWTLILDTDHAYVVAHEWIRTTARRSVDGARRLGTVEVESTQFRAVGDTVAAAAAFDRGALGFAAQQCGLAARMLHMTVEYAKQRTQFGLPIGSFQAVKHHLANARVALEFARPLVYRAAWSIDAGHPQASMHVSMAKSAADDAAHVAGRAALQCHGAIGYTTEYDLHLYLKRSWALARSWGDATWHRTRVGTALADRQTA